MKVGEIYSVICIIFASNFKDCIDEETFKNLVPSWLIKTPNKQNELGLNEWKKSLKSENSKIIAVDFVAIKHGFELDYFEIIDEAKMVDWYKKTRFEIPFKNLKHCHISNLLAFLAAVLRNDKDEKTHLMLGKFLVEYFLPSAFELCKYLQKNAGSHYYGAFGYFLEDFCLNIKDTLGLKFDILE